MNDVLQQLHFLRPLFLLGLPVSLLMAAWLWRRQPRSRWHAVLDHHLLPHLLHQGQQQRAWPAGLVLLGGLLASLALAGPSWQRLPQPVFESADHQVLVMDLSASMRAADSKPSRLLRAKIAARSVLEAQTEGDSALVAFAGSAFAVVPLTRDRATVIHLLDSLDTSLMPVQGSRIDLGLAQAQDLLEQVNASDGEIILITDSAPDRRSHEALAAARRAGFRVSVVAIGSPQGAPIPAENGGWLKDRHGGIVVATTDHAALRDLARQGGGRFAAVDHGELDWSRAPSVAGRLDGDRADDEFEADLWRDGGALLLPPLLLIAALGFRRGWLAVALLALLPVPPAQAGWWRTPDQEAHQKLQQDDAEAAAQQFQDPAWRASALYRDEDYAGAAKVWSQLDSATAHYNRGNALARAGQLEEALAAYQTALERDPKLRDAQSNRDLVEKLLEQQQQEQQQGQDGESSEESEQSEDGDGQPSAPESGTQDQAGEQSDGQQGEPSPQDGEQSGSEPGESAAQDDAAEDNAADNAQPAEPAQDGEQSAAQSGDVDSSQDEQDQAVQQWLRRIPDDPGGLLRRKFQRLESRRESAQDEEQAW